MLPRVKVTPDQGAIHLDSAPGHGTLDKVHLPRSSDQATGPNTAPATAAPAGHETVLLVDDDDSVRRAARRVLERLGYTVLEAPDAEFAIRLSLSHTGEIDLLLSDIVLPTMDGLKLSEQVRTARPGIGTLFMSGYAPGQDAARPFAGDSLHHIQKPFELDAFAAAVRQAIHERSAK